MTVKKWKRAGAWILAFGLTLGAVQPPPMATKAAETDLEAFVKEIEEPVIGAGGDIAMPSGLPSGAKIRFCADYEQIIGEDGTVYPTLEDKTVKGFYEVYRETGEDEAEESAKTAEFTIEVPGENTSAAGANAKPDVIPQLQEWQGKTGSFEAAATGRIVVGSKELFDVANLFAEDYKEITGMDIHVISGSESDLRMGDFYLTLTDYDMGLGKEGYTMDIDSAVIVEAEQTAGLYWSTRTILQLLKQNNGSMSKGCVRDYPKYEVRAFSLDVGRKPFTMDALYQFAKNMSWYKMNSFQVHLSDNLIFMEDYKTIEEAKEKAYAGFRLESDVLNNEGKSATSEDLYYTKEEFRSFIQDCRVMGMDIVPEFDMPAHALPFTRAFPEYRSKKETGGSHAYLIDELDLSNPETTEFAKRIWNDYFEGPDPVFDEQTTIHIGTDEYHGTDGQEGKEQFRKFSDDMIRFVQESGRTVRMWGSLTNKSGTQPVKSKGVQLNIWETSYANPQRMHELGFDMINTLVNNGSGSMYIVPSGSGSMSAYGDFLNTQNIYNRWQVNGFNNYTVPAGDDQMLGGCFAVWHDNIDTRAGGISQYDSFYRFMDGLPVISAKLWGDLDTQSRTYEQFKELAAKVGTAPNTNMYADVDSAATAIAKYTFQGVLTKDDGPNGYDLQKVVNAAAVGTGSEKALQLNGGESYAETPLNQVGCSAVLTMKVKMDVGAEEGSEQILCESKDAFGTYGTYAVKARVKQTGNVGFSREGYDYSFDYKLPEGEWVELSFHSGQDTVALYADGELVDNDPDFYEANHPETELSAKRGNARVATMLVPFGRIGSATDSFQGQIAEITLNGTKEVSGEYETVSAGELQTEMKKFNSSQAKQYTDVTWNAYQAAYQNAAAVLDYIGSTDTDFIYVYEQLKKAKEELVEVDAAARAAYQLASATDQAEELLSNTAGYTAESVRALQQAVRDAKRLLNKWNAPEAELSAALKKLKESKLEKPVTPPQPENPNDNNNNNQTPDPGTTVPKPKVPKKGAAKTVGGVTYKVTKSDAVNGTVAASKLKETNKTKITIPAAVEIDGVSFQVTAVSNKAFQNAKKLNTVVIGANVANIGSKAFYNCKKLKKITFNGVKAPKIGSKAFKGIVTKSKITVSKKMAKKQLNSLKAALKKAGVNKKASYKTK